MGYTAQFGNGFSATIAAEAPRRTQLIGNPVSVAGVTPGAPLGGGTITGAFGGTNAAGDYGGFQVPDVVGNLRVDQAWGSAQVMAAYHDVNPGYYLGLGTTQVQTFSGGPDDHKAGWAAGFGFKINTPFFSQGDYIQTQFNYTQGALRYIFQTPNSNHGINEGSEASFGVLSDGVFNGVLGAVGGLAPSAVELTTAWNVNAAYEHFWNPRWRTSLYGGYAAVKYNDQANNFLCTGLNTAPLAGANVGCDMDFQTWWAGTRTQWNVTKDFYMGLDVMYSKLQSANLGTGLVTAGVPGLLVANRSLLVGGGTAVATDQDNWSFRFRVHRDFYP
jgi:hypothetical protein